MDLVVEEAVGEARRAAVPVMREAEMLLVLEVVFLVRVVVG